jgi:hypothetical protein
MKITQFGADRTAMFVEVELVAVSSTAYYVPANDFAQVFGRFRDRKHQVIRPVCTDAS